MKALAFILLLLPSVISAETQITVRAGEHDGFTRVTFASANRVEWSLDGDSLTFSGDIKFDLSQTFERIGRDRLSAIRSDGNKLILDLACECMVSAFQAAEGLVAADIRPGAKPSPPTASTPVPSPQPLGGTVNLRRLLLAPHLDTYSSEVSSDLETGAPVEGGIDLAEPREADLEELSRSIARAATLGLVSTKPDMLPEAENIDIQSNAVTMALSQTTTRIGALFDPEDSGLKVDSCPDIGAMPELAETGIEDKGARIKAAVSESGRVATTELVNAADFFLSLGFGAEAVEILSASSGDHRHRQAIALFLDQQEIAEVPFHKAHLHCDTDAALWAFLILNSSEELEGIDLASLVARFQTWPFAVRKIAGPALNSALIERDRFDLARIVIRLSTVSDSGAKLARAELEASQGNLKAALEHLEPATDGDQSAQQVLARLRLKLDNREKVGLKDIQIAHSLLREHADLPIGRTLRNAVIEAYVVHGDLQSAIDVAGLTHSVLDDGETLFGHAIEYLPAEDFAWAAFAFWRGQEEFYSDDLNAKMSAALDTVGFSPAKAAGLSAQTLGSKLVDLLEEPLAPDETSQEAISISFAADVLDRSIEATAMLASQLSDLGSGL